MAVQRPVQMVVQTAVHTNSGRATGAIMVNGALVLRPPLADAGAGGREGRQAGGVGAGGEGAIGYLGQDEMAGRAWLQTALAALSRLTFWPLGAMQNG
jgi:hypothetical protein